MKSEGGTKKGWLPELEDLKTRQALAAKMGGAEKVTHLPFWKICVDNLSQVPVVALALGSVAGLGAARVTASHYSVIVKETAQMFVAGPPVVARIGQVMDKNELGGADVHTRIGAIDDDAKSEAEAFAMARRFLSYLPSSVHELPARTPPTDDPKRRVEWLIDAIPRGVQAAYRAEIEAAADPDAKRAEIEGRLDKLGSPLRSAESFIIEEIIDPRDTRRILTEFATLAAPLRTPGAPSFGYRP